MKKGYGKWYNKIVREDRVVDATEIPLGKGLATRYITEATPADWVARGIVILAIGLLVYKAWEILH